jgi:hypothetical protein
MIVAISVAAGACFGASIYAALVAVGAKKVCDHCVHWAAVAGERAHRVAELERLNEALILGAVERLGDVEW